MSASDLSLWHDQLPARVPRPALTGDVQVDLAIVGGGYTGLWTAYHAKRAEPSLRIAVVEREVVGFGASGRNGGWCSALFPTSWRRLSRDAGRADVQAMQRHLEEAVRQVGDSGIDCGFHLGGMVSLARNAAQLARARSAVDEARFWGFGPATLDLLSAQDAHRRVHGTRVLGALTTDHCATLHPGRLVQGLASAVEALGVTLYERTPALSVQPGKVVTPHGTIGADVVLLATEGYTAQLPGHRRDLTPVYSLMLATEPLPSSMWDTIGLADRPTFADKRHLTVYGQRTQDGRIAFGGRGARYHFGSRVDPTYDRVPAVHAALHAALVDLFPVLEDVAVTHRWGGALGVPRDWFPSVGLDRRTGLAWAGGYVGDGVASAHLAGQTLADLLLERDTERTRLPWVRRRTRRWEPEPLRWLGVNAVTVLMAHADRTEAATGRPSRAAAAFWKSLGH